MNERDLLWLADARIKSGAGIGLGDGYPVIGVER